MYFCVDDTMLMSQRSPHRKMANQPRRASAPKSSKSLVVRAQKHWRMSTELNRWQKYKNIVIECRVTIDDPAWRILKLTSMNALDAACRTWQATWDAGRYHAWIYQAWHRSLWTTFLVPNVHLRCRLQCLQRCAVMLQAINTTNPPIRRTTGNAGMITDPGSSEKCTNTTYALICCTWWRYRKDTGALYLYLYDSRLPVDKHRSLLANNFFFVMGSKRKVSDVPTESSKKLKQPSSAPSKHHPHPSNIRSRPILVSTACKKEYASKRFASVCHFDLEILW